MTSHCPFKKVDERFPQKSLNIIMISNILKPMSAILTDCLNLRAKDKLGDAKTQQMSIPKISIY